MCRLNFRVCLDDLDALMRLDVKADNCKHYEHVLLHVDDTLLVSKNTEKILRN